MSVILCKKGELKVPTGPGALNPYMALTKQASYAIEGATLANLVYLAGATKKFWNPSTGSYAADIRINGVVSGCDVVGDASTNNVQVSAGVINLNGAQVTVNADTTNAITRGAAGKYAVSAICANGSGVVSVVKGTDGDTLDLTSGYDGAGQKPLVATNLVVLAYVVTLGDTAAVIPATDIYAGESAMVAKRIDHLRGGIILQGAALELNHTGGVSRGVYAQFYCQQAVLVAVASLENLKFDVKVATYNQTNFDSEWEQNVEGRRSWTATATKKKVDDYFWDKAVTPGEAAMYLVGRRNASDTNGIIGVGILQGSAEDIKHGPMGESLSFLGTGELVKDAA